MLPKPDYIIPRDRVQDMYPALWNGLSQTGRLTKRWHGESIKNYYVLYRDRKHVAIHIKKDWQVIGNFLLDKFITTPQHFPRIVKNNQTLSKQTGDLSRSILKQLPHASLKKQCSFLVRLKRQWLAYDAVNVLPWFLGGEPLRNYLENTLKENFAYTAFEIETVCSPNTLSLAAEEELAVLETALSRKPIPPQAKKLSDQFGWMPFGYDGPTYWDAAFYEQKVNKTKKETPSVITKRIAAIRKQLEKIQNRQRTLLKKLPANIKRLLDIQQKLYMLTDQRKKVHFFLHYVYHEVLAQISTACGLSVHELKYLEAEEIQSMMSSKQYHLYQALARKRITKPVLVHLSQGKVVKLFIGAEAVKKLSEFAYDTADVQEFSGQVANKSKTGVITGAVRKIMDPRDMNTMQKGEILVTGMTTPDFVPAMRKAKAIITDEGGITSHAAIVSRELGIPCIIGTKLATQVLATGDIIEMDTNKGVIKKIS